MNAKIDTWNKKNATNLSFLPQWESCSEMELNIISQAVKVDKDFDFWKITSMFLLSKWSSHIIFDLLYIWCENEILPTNQQKLIWSGNIASGKPGH
jgi:hypothetical protein